MSIKIYNYFSESFDCFDCFYLDLANEGLDQYAESVIKRVLKSGKLLTHSEIQEIIDNVNDQYSQDIQRLDLIRNFFLLTLTKEFEYLCTCLS